MTTFSAWLPDMICALIVALYVWVLKKKFFKMPDGFPAFCVGCFVLLASAIAVAFLWRTFFIDATPDENWETQATQTSTALIFGFGYEKNEKGVMTAGAANQALYNQAVMDANYQYLIMQEGVMAAASQFHHCDGTCHCEESLLPLVSKRGGYDKAFLTYITSVNNKFITMTEEIPMHSLDMGYVNTLAAAKYAILKMDSLHVKRVVVYAHNHQLGRAVYDLRRIAAYNTQYRDMVFITPNILPTPYPRHSAQWYTRHPVIYFPIELFISRPLNTIYPL